MLLADSFFQLFNRKMIIKGIKKSLQTHSSSAQSFLEASLSINIPCTAPTATRPARKSNKSLAIFLFPVYTIALQVDVEADFSGSCLLCVARHLGKCPQPMGRCLLFLCFHNSFLAAELFSIWFSKEAQTLCLLYTRMISKWSTIVETTLAMVYCIGRASLKELRILNL